MTTARDIMTATPDVVAGTTTAVEVAKKLASGNYGALPVCDGDELLGMITDRDLVVRVLAEDMDPTTTTVRDLIGGAVVTIGADDSVEDAMRTMAEHQVRRLPVLDGGRMVGIVSQADIALSGNDKAVGDTVQAISR